MASEENSTCCTRRTAYNFVVRRRALDLHRVVMLLLTSCNGTESSVVDSVFDVLSSSSSRRRTSWQQAMQYHFFRSLLRVASAASSFTRSFRSSSHLLAGLPTFLWVFVDLWSLGFTQPLSSSIFLCFVLQFARLVATSVASNL